MGSIRGMRFVCSYLYVHYLLYVGDRAELSQPVIGF